MTGWSSDPDRMTRATVKETSGSSRSTRAATSGAGAVAGFKPPSAAKMRGGAGEPRATTPIKPPLWSRPPAADVSAGRCGRAGLCGCSNARSAERLPSPLPDRREPAHRVVACGLISRQDPPIPKEGRTALATSAAVRMTHPAGAAAVQAEPEKNLGGDEKPDGRACRHDWIAPLRRQALSTSGPGRCPCWRLGFWALSILRFRSWGRRIAKEPHAWRSAA